MKEVIIINGPMGVGKTTISKLLCNKLDKSGFLDGDWCFDLHPFIANKETKTMAIDNISYIIRNYIKCSECQYVVFNWVMDEEYVYEQILYNLSDMELQLIKVTLTCNEDALEDRWYKDRVNDWRIKKWLDVSKKSLPYFEQLDTIKIDTSDISPEIVAEKIYLIINQ